MSDSCSGMISAQAILSAPPFFAWNVTDLPSARLNRKYIFYRVRLQNDGFWSCDPA